MKAAQITHPQLWWWAALSTAAILMVGCNEPAGSPAASQPASQSTSAPASAPPAPPVRESWSPDEARSKLKHSDTRIQAALRLVELANLAPQMWINAGEGALRLLDLGDLGWCLGAALPDHSRGVSSPVLISQSGEVAEQPIDSENGAASVLVASAAPSAFPHVIMDGPRVLVWLEDEWAPALQLAEPPELRFVVRTTPGGERLLLLVPSAASGDPPIAEYHWDFFEGTFVGPARDKSERVTGGQWALDTEGSPLLLPVGGQTAAKRRNKPLVAQPDKQAWPPQ